MMYIYTLLQLVCISLSSTKRKLALTFFLKGIMQAAIPDRTFLDRPITLVDVGGARQQRKKWIHSLDGLDACIYCFSLVSSGRGGGNNYLIVHLDLERLN